MPMEKVNVYASYSCLIMGIDSFGIHTINLFISTLILGS